MVHHGITFLPISLVVNPRNNKLNIMERIVQNNPLRYITTEVMLHGKYQSYFQKGKKSIHKTV